MSNVEGLTAGAGALPTPLRRLDGNGAVVVCALPGGTAAQVVRLHGHLLIQVSTVVPTDEVDGVAEHCYGQHRSWCHASTCGVARALTPLPATMVGAASA